MYFREDADDSRLSHGAIQARNAEWSRRQLLRLAKGRPAVRKTFQQFDAGKRALFYTATPDPILDLYAARRLRRSSAFHAQRYGEILQTVVSPVGVLP